MNSDNRPGHEGRFRLEPIPPNPGWRVKLPKWLPGSLRGGFELHLGHVTYGCINVLIDDPNAKAQYEQMLQLLQAEDGNNHLLVAP